MKGKAVDVYDIYDGEKIFVGTGEFIAWGGPYPFAWVRMDDGSVCEAMPGGVVFREWGPMKSDEKELLEVLQRQAEEGDGRSHIRKIINDLGMNKKRAAYILEKWSRRGWYSYGADVLAGSLTREGRSLNVE